MKVAAVVLAAGSASRFGGGKVLADLDGRPLLRHVVDAARAAGLGPIVVVGPPSGALEEVDLGDVRRVVNPQPEGGLSGSVRIGLRALDDDDGAEAVESAEAAEAAVILPGDQPRVRPAVIRALIDTAAEVSDAGFVVPRYSADGSRNPVLVRRAVWRLADELAGDRGFGPLLAAHRELIREVAVDGDNPDVDTQDDLRRLAATGSRPGDVS
jgi:molybdenum cofactor cytidylyltransferase